MFLAPQEPGPAIALGTQSKLRTLMFPQRIPDCFGSLKKSPHRNLYGLWGWSTENQWQNVTLDIHWGIQLHLDVCFALLLLWIFLLKYPPGLQLRLLHSTPSETDWSPYRLCQKRSCLFQIFKSFYTFQVRQHILEKACLCLCFISLTKIQLYLYNSNTAASLQLSIFFTQWL